MIRMVAGWGRPLTALTAVAVLYAIAVPPVVAPGHTGYTHSHVGGPILTPIPQAENESDLSPPGGKAVAHFPDGQIAVSHGCRALSSIWSMGSTPGSRRSACIPEERFS